MGRGITVKMSLENKRMAPKWEQTCGGIMVPGTKWEAVGKGLEPNISYWVVKTDNGSVFKRNRILLKPVLNSVHLNSSLSVP